jgi:hypothetical protein
MAEVLTADPAALERMGRAGAAQVAERHDACTQAKRLMDLFANAGAISNRPSQHAPLSRVLAAR